MQRGRETQRRGERERDRTEVNVYLACVGVRVRILHLKRCVGIATHETHPSSVSSVHPRTPVSSSSDPTTGGVDGGEEVLVQDTKVQSTERGRAGFPRDRGASRSRGRRSLMFTDVH